jgi:hypothetical protein
VLRYSACLLIASLCLSAPARGEEPSTRDRVLELLKGYEFEPGQSDWDEIGPEAASALMDIASDTDQIKIVRARALAALRFFPQTKVRTFIVDLLSMDEQDEMLLRKGLYALASGFGKDSLDDIALFLGHANADVREAAARAVGKIVSWKSLKLLKKRAKVEKNGMVLEVVKDQIKNLKQKLKKKVDE